MPVKPPSWYYAIAGIATLWALMGCYAYIDQVTMTAIRMSQLPPDQREIWEMMPKWLTAVYAIAVWFGLIGAIALLLRRRIARAAYIVSLAAVVVQFGWILTQTPIVARMGFATAAGFPIFIALAGAALVGFADYAVRRNWLR